VCIDTVALVIGSSNGRMLLLLLLLTSRLLKGAPAAGSTLAGPANAIAIMRVVSSHDT
jgi:hypothetical protein